MKVAAPTVNGAVAMTVVALLCTLSPEAVVTRLFRALMYRNIKAGPAAGPAAGTAASSACTAVQTTEPEVSVRVVLTHTEEATADPDVKVRTFRAHTLDATAAPEVSVRVVRTHTEEATAAPEVSVRALAVHTTPAVAKEYPDLSEFDNSLLTVLTDGTMAPVWVPDSNVTLPNPQMVYLVVLLGFVDQLGATAAWLVEAVNAVIRRDCPAPVPATRIRIDPAGRSPEDPATSFKAPAVPEAAVLAWIGLAANPKVELVW